MRILTLTNLYPNPLEPQRAVYTRLQMRELAQRHDLAVIAPIAWTDEFVHWRHRRVLPRTRQSTLDGICIEHPRYYFMPRTLRRWHGHFYHWSVRSTFQRALAEFRPDLVYAPWAYPDGWAAVHLGHAAGLPVVVKVVGSDFLSLHAYPDRRPGTLAALQDADAVIAVSQDLARRMTDAGIGSNKIRVVYDGIDPTVFVPGDRQDACRRLGLPHHLPLILFVGNLLPVKGLDVLLDACVRLTRAGLSYRCHLIGQGPLRAKLERDVRTIGLGDHVRFMGTIPNNELPDWYRAARVLALPSRSEGVPNVLLEATACGTPFVASRVGGIPEIAHFGKSLLVTPQDPAELTSALAHMLSDSSRTSPTPPPRSRAQSARELLDVFVRVVQQRHISS